MIDRPAFVPALALCLWILPFSDTLGQAPRVVSEPTLLVEAEGQGRTFFQPRWSPDGSRIAFTTDRYTGLWVADATGDNVRQIADDRGAGFGFQWSPDGSSIVSRVARYDDLRRSDAVKLFRVEEPGEQFLTEYRSDMPTLPRWTRDGAHVVLVGESGVEVLAAEPGSAKAVAREPVVLIRGDRLMSVRPAEATADDIEVLPQGNPINLVQSPDGQRVAFEIVGGNLFAMSSAGGPAVDLGPGHRPQWSPDGEWIVYMRTEDDGHVFTSADLYAARSDGSATVRLTDSADRLEMNPSWSPDGSRIAFDDGKSIYVMQISY